MKVLSYRDLFPKKGVPYSRVHTDRLEAAGKFPKRIYLSENTVVWSEEEIDAWLEANHNDVTRVERRGPGRESGAVDATAATGQGDR